MKMIKDLFQSIGFILLGVLSLIMVVVMLFVGALRMLGKFVAFTINAKIAERYHKDDPAEVNSK